MNDAIEQAVSLFGEHFQIDDIGRDGGWVSLDLPLSPGNWLTLHDLHAEGNILRDDLVAGRMLAIVDNLAKKYGDRGAGDVLREFARRATRVKNSGSGDRPARIDLVERFDDILSRYGADIDGRPDGEPSFRFPRLSVSLGQEGNRRFLRFHHGRQCLLAYSGPDSEPGFFLGDAIPGMLPERARGYAKMTPGMDGEPESRFRTLEDSPGMRP